MLRRRSATKEVAVRAASQPTALLHARKNVLCSLRRGVCREADVERVAPASLNQNTSVSQSRHHLQVVDGGCQGVLRAIERGSKQRDSRFVCPALTTLKQTDGGLC